MLKENPSQTAGPYVHIGCVPSFAGLEGPYEADLGARMVFDGAKGTPITLEGQVIDGAGAPLKDALLEIWQADAAGLFNSPGETRGSADPAFTGWGRQPTDGESGLYRFETLKPGAVPGPGGALQAPHILMWIVARGINLGLTTRVYFADEEAANAADPILARIEHRDRVPTLMAQPQGAGRYRFDIHLQGPHETLFFDI